jgi:sulfite exporter TauE/SafE
MVGTIGSLVQETSNRWRWLRVAGLYTLACMGTAMLLGAALGALGLLLSTLFHSTTISALFPQLGIWIIGLLAIAYAASDVGLLRMPRPILSKAVPISWWRWWGPYRAALAYGAALGIGVMTRIPFGAFYVLCTWCVLKGNPVYGAVLMGTYGVMRALVLLPVSWDLNCSHTPITEWATSPFFNQWRAQQVLAVALILFGTYALASTVLGLP